MRPSRPTRRLAAIMFTDMVGYSALVGRNEKLAYRLLSEQRSLVRSTLPQFAGREVEIVGDAFLLEFSSALMALQCAVALQQKLAARSNSRPADERIALRIGLHMGDIERPGKKVYGDTVNIAARLQDISPKGGVAMSHELHSQVRNKLALPYRSIGAIALKNIAEPVEIFTLDAAAIAAAPAMSGPDEALVDSERKSRRPLILAAVAGMALVLLAAGGAWLLRSLQVRPVEKSVAVLPFENFGEPQNQYFTDGLHDSLITDLAQIHDLKVIARSSVMKFRDGNRDMRAIAQALGVARLVEGSVQKVGDHLRINIQMIDPATSGHVWAELYDRNAGDVFTVQSEVAERVAASLQAELTGVEKQRIERRPTDNKEAYDAYMQGMFYGRSSGADVQRKSIAAFEEAVRLDPGFALAFCDEGISWMNLAFTQEGDNKQEAQQAMGKARAALRRAIELQPDLAKAHATLSHILSTVDWNFEGAAAELQLAQAAAPDDFIVKYYLAQLSATQGKLDAALGLAVSAARTDPMSPSVQTQIVLFLTALGRYDEADRAAQTVLKLDPRWSVVYTQRAIAAIKRGDAAAALRYAQQEPAEYWKAYAVALALSAGGDRAAADAALKAFIEKYSDGGAFQIAVVYASRGETDQAFEWLDRAYALRDSGLPTLLYHPFLAALKSDPRFASLCKKLGLPLPGSTQAKPARSNVMAPSSALAI